MEQFLNDTLLRGTKGKVFVCSLSQNKEGREERIITRSVWRIKEFVAKWDQPGRALYYCVATLSKAWRKKENALEGTFAFADVDLKDLDLTLEQVLECLDKLQLYPSRINSSGHGLHLYWYLDEPTNDFDRLEEVNQKIGEVVAGDPRARHSVTLLRVPGSHNSKNGDWLPVELVRDSQDRRYSLDDLDEWAQSPVITPKSAPTASEGNPFLAHAKVHGFHVPIDVDKRLADMRYQGVGDASIHLTQLSVTASLVAAGWSEDDIVAKVLPATEAAATGQSWDWEREELKIRRMSHDFDRKVERASAAGGSRSVVSLAEKRRERQSKTTESEDQTAEPEKKGKKGKKDKSAHVVLGGGVLKYLEGMGESILTRGSEVWRCRRGLWSLLAPADVRAWLDRIVEIGCRMTNVTSNGHLVGETRNWILRNPDLNRDDVEWDVHHGIPLKNGLLDPKTMTLQLLRPDHYATTSIQADYLPGANCPHWRGMMAEIFPGADEHVRFIQEALGVALLPRKSRNLMKALVLIGPSNCGKSNVLEVLGRMMNDSLNTTPFEQLENAHGMMDFLRPAPWVLHEAFSQNKWHFSSQTKALLTGDPINVNIKNGPVVSHIFRSPVFWGTNHPPHFKESSRAMENRLAIIPCRQVFDEVKITGEALAAAKMGYSSPAEMVLAEERSGLLNWALEGMIRAVDRMSLGLTPAMRTAAKEMADDENYAVGFFQDAVEWTPDGMIAKTDLYGAFTSWWEEEVGGSERGKPPGPESFGRMIKSMFDDRIASDKNLLRSSGGVRYYAGVRLNSTGLSLWNAGSSAALSSGDKKRYASREEEVNHEIPKDWSNRLCVEKMRAAHARRKT